MEEYIVSARKYRPQTFESVVGQTALTTTLKNAIQTGKLAHAYLFCGPRGVGKTTCARIFAKTINCQNLTPEGEACNECESCRSFNERRSLNIHELDAASNNSVDDIRSLIEQVRIPPQLGKYKVYIIDEVHMLSAAAFNAFLKTLEEPPAHAVFILATTEKHKILPTILSRCQIYDFNRISVEDISAHLASVATKEQIHFEPEALNVIATKADGGMRDALSVFDQVVSFTNGQITYQSVIQNLNVLDYDYYFKLTDLFLTNQVPSCLLLFNEILNKGFEGGNFITGLSKHLRDVLVSKDAATVQLLEVGAGIRKRYAEQAAKCSTRFLYKAMELSNQCDLNYRASKNKRLLVELTLIQIAQLNNEPAGNGSRPQPTSGNIQPLFGSPAQPQQPGQPTGTAQKTTAYQSQPIAQSNLKEPQPAKAEETAGPTVLPEAAREKEVKANAPKVSAFKNLNKIGISIKQAISAEKEVIPQPVEPQTEKNDLPVNESDLNRTWQEYADSLPNDLIATAKRMKLMSVGLVNDTEAEITVENELVANEFKEISRELTDYWRSQLRNRHISLRIKINEKQPTQAYAMTRKEKFQHMAEKNRALIDLKNAFGLELY